MSQSVQETELAKPCWQDGGAMTHEGHKKQHPLQWDSRCLGRQHKKKKVKKKGEWRCPLIQ